MTGLDDLTLILVAVVFVVPHLVRAWWRRRRGAPSMDSTRGEPSPIRPGRSARRLAVVACMDTRLDVEALLGLQPGDAHILRNAGGLATDDVLRSLIISWHFQETRAVIFLHHTDCALTHFHDHDLQEDLAAATGQVPVRPIHFHTFCDQEDNLRRQMRRVKSHPWLPGPLTVRGFVYDVQTGALREIVDDKPYPAMDLDQDDALVEAELIA